MKKQFYLDAAATTPVLPEVQKVMEKALFANPSSAHMLGEEAKLSLSEARKKFALELNCKPTEIIFTSGGTESNNLAIRGIAKYSKKKKIIISSIEHPSVQETARSLDKVGFKVKKIPVRLEGILDIHTLEKELTKDVAIVSIMHVNNIIGTIQDIKKIGSLCEKKNIPFHTDAVQSFGKIKIDVKENNISLLSASAHKLGGPKGIGLLYIKENNLVNPQITGGGQEFGIRSGTENLPGILGFAKAIELSKESNKKEIEKTRDYLIKKIKENKIKINGSTKERIYNNVNFTIPEVEADVLVTFLSRSGIHLSAGSACDSIKKEDHVLQAIGLSSGEAKSSLRISLLEPLSEKDCDFIIQKIISTAKVLRQNI